MDNSKDLVILIIVICFFIGNLIIPERRSRQSGEVRASSPA